MLTIACVYKTGGVYSWEYVSRLAKGVHKWLKIPHLFTCLSDDHMYDPRLFRVVFLKRKWPSWWSKMEVFGLRGPVLYLDLDTVIVGSLDPLAQAVIDLKTNQLLVLEDFYLRGGKASTGIMGWSRDMTRILGIFRSEAKRAIWRQNQKNTQILTPRGRFRGDQEWLRDYLKKNLDISTVLAQRVVPGVLSYKVHIRNKNQLPGEAMVICFHGRPRPHEVIDEAWMAEEWGIQQRNIMIS